MYLLFIFIYAFGVVTRKSPEELAYFGLLFLGVVLIMRPKRRVLGKLCFLLGFEGLLFITALFNQGHPLFQTPFGPVTVEGVSSFFMLLCKAFLSAGTVVVITDSVGFSRLLAEMRALGFPRVLVLTLAFTYRYMDLLVDETRRMKRALDSRAFGVGKREYYRMLGSLMGEVLLRAYLRSGRVYRAMLSRGFGEFPSMDEPRPNLQTAVLAVLALGGLLI
ncbi:ABC-type cobalt transport system, permease component CbiQ-related transporters [Thermococcus nautili]|uniref:energy-coupling factor transporter transmembrane component T family protein n=1 Tax=Thermococcus nautili TaxID=195522 RepID=UPI0025561226|nr:energy-coupling factor transporter transmembrane component T [Thermococcus nautili]CAI1491892.1 ABC-type cobalt transport system, permease component CbiQ-related transporters [Thermococcus nautili]